MPCPKTRTTSTIPSFFDNMAHAIDAAVLNTRSTVAFSVRNCQKMFEPKWILSCSGEQPSSAVKGSERNSPIHTCAVYVQIYIYIYIYTYAHVYIHIYIYIYCIHTYTVHTCAPAPTRVPSESPCGFHYNSCAITEAGTSHIYSYGAENSDLNPQQPCWFE